MGLGIDDAAKHHFHQVMQGLAQLGIRPDGEQISIRLHHMEHRILGLGRIQVNSAQAHVGNLRPGPAIGFAIASGFPIPSVLLKQAISLNREELEFIV